MLGFLCHLEWKVSTLIALFCIASTSGFSAEYKVVTRGDKQGLADETGNLVIPIIYDNLGWSDGSDQLVDDVIGYFEDKQWGLINVRNERLSPPLYTDLHPIDQENILASRTGQFLEDVRYGLLNSKGKAILGFQYCGLMPRGGNLIACQQIEGKTKWGVLNYQEQVIIPINYDRIKPTHLNYFVFDEGRAAVFSPQGIRLSEFAYDSIRELGSNTVVMDHLGKEGLLDHLGRRVIETEYKSIRQSSDSLFALRSFPKWELIIPGQGTIEEFYFDDIVPVNHGIFRVTTNDRQAIINIAGEYLLEGNDWEIGVLDEQFVLVTQRGKQGVLQEGGIDLLPVKFDSIHYSGKHFYVLTRDDAESWQVYSTYGNLISSSNYEAVYPMTEEMMATKKHGYWGYIDFSGHVLVDYKFDEAWPFYEGRAKVNYLGNQGVINTAGEWVIHPNHAEVTIVNRDLFINHAGTRFDLLDGRERTIYQTYNRLKPHSFGLVEITESGKLGLINHRGQSVLPPVFDHISELSGNLVYLLQRGDQYAVLDQDGRYVLDFTDEYTAIGGLSEGFLKVKKDNRYGFIDLDGNLRIANRYEAVKDFVEGMAAVKLVGKWGFIDRLERLRIQPRYEEVGDFNRGIAVVKRDGKAGIIDLEGNEILPIDYDEVGRNDKNSFVLIKDKRYGLASFRGELQIQPKFELLEENENGLVIVKQRGRYGVIEKSGINVIPMVYDEVIYDKINGYYLAKKASEETVVPAR